ncbi:MAG: xylulokinase [Rhodoferax sp.]
MYLGLDIGTSEVKALLLDDAQRVIAACGAPLEVQRPAPHHSEQHPADWWQACCSALAQLRAQAPQAYAATRAIGLSGQMHGAVLLDARAQVLRPAILWNDTRSAAECRTLMDAVPALPQRCGSLAMPGSTAPKLLWVARHEPALFARVAKVLLPKDYVRYRLSGEYVSDMSDASGTAWLDVAQRRWDEELLQACGLQSRHMPALVEGDAVSSTLRADIAAELGLRAGIPIAGGGGDNAASAVGMGACEAGQGFLSLGTSGVLFVVTPRYQPNPQAATHAFCHALQGRWHQMSVMLSAASALQWASTLLREPVATLAERAAALSPAQRASAPLFLPYLSGERTPHNDAHVRASLHGMDMQCDAPQVAYAVMEGVAFALRDGLCALQQAGCEARELSVVGGGARSAFWTQMLASCLQVPLCISSAAAHGGALGAARLAWLADGGLPSDVCTRDAHPTRFTPDAQEHALLLPRYQRFRTLYQPGAALPSH